jgi:hypothetical protein
MISERHRVLSDDKRAVINGAHRLRSEAMAAFAAACVAVPRDGASSAIAWLRAVAQCAIERRWLRPRSG